MKTALYFDNPEEGLSRDTSHPRFVELASDDFYYSGIDDFSPFGSDDGHDTLAALEDWYRAPGKQRKAFDFLESLLANWDFGVPPSILRADDASRTAWLDAAEMNESFLASECHARVATAFGQLKISGEIDAEILDEALAAIECERWLNERARTKYPTWPYADQHAQRLAQMQSLLHSI